MKLTKKLLSLILVLALTLSISVPSVPVSAAVADFTKAKTLTMNGTEVFASITDANPQHLYKINVTSTGKVTFNFAKYFSGNVQCFLVDKDETQTIELVDLNDIKNGGTGRGSITAYLSTGTYYLVVKKGNGTGKVSVSARFSAVTNTDNEPNDMASNANVVSTSGKKNGLFTYGDTIDFYKVTIPSTGIFKITVDKNINAQTDFSIRNEDATDVIMTRSILATAKKGVIEIALDPGVYYISVNPVKKAYGTYTLTTSFAKKASDREPNDTFAGAQVLSMGARKTQKGFFSYTDVNDFYKFTLPQAGRASFTFQKYFGGNIEYAIFAEDMVTSVKSGVNSTKGTTSKATNFNFSADLEAGTYYLKLNAVNKISTGVYIMNYQYNKVANDAATNNSYKTPQALVKGNKFLNAFLSIQDDSDYYSFKLETQGKVAITVYKGFAGKVDYEIYNALSQTVLKEGTLNGAGMKELVFSLDRGEYCLRIKKNVQNTGVYKLAYTTSAPSAVTVYQVKAGDTKVTGLTSPNTKVVVRAAGKTYTGYSNNNGQFSVKVPKQKKNATVSVYASNKIANTKTKATKVK